jgi:6-phosphogluconolactonase (cycloisomerase 2 family)
MKRIVFSIIFTVALLVGVTAAFSTGVLGDAGPDLHSGSGNGAVFAMTNPNGAANAVVMFDRDAHGALTPVAGSPFATGGDGGKRSGPADPLKSQGSLMLTQDGRWLLAVNAGSNSNSISVFKVGNDKLTLVDTESSNGNFPASLTISDNEVFVLNAGTSPNITGFTLSKMGHLSPIAGSTTLLPPPTTLTLYTQVGFDNTGKWLVVSDLGDSMILTYPVNSSGIPGTLKSSLSSGPAPFGFVFDGKNHLLVVQAGNSAVSSYSVLSSGMLSPITEAFNPTSSTACWIVEDQSNDVYTTNPGTMNISSYQDAGNSGNIGWLNASAASGIATIDEGITNNGRFLYALSPTGNIDGYKIAGDGSLMMVGTFSAAGITLVSQGLAAW